MDLKRICRSLLVWLCFIPVAILNGGLRQYLLAGWLGSVGAMAVSGILLSLFILFITWVLLPRVANLVGKERLVTGSLWMVLTVCFECVAGLAAGLSFGELLDAYNPSTGNLWLLVVITTFAAPMVSVSVPHTMRPEVTVKSRMIELYRGELWECQFLETLLKDAGVKCFLRNHVQSGYGPIVSSAQQVQVMIDSDDLERGNRLLTDFLDSRKQK